MSAQANCRTFLLQILFVLLICFRRTRGEELADSDGWELLNPRVTDLSQQDIACAELAILETQYKDMDTFGANSPDLSAMQDALNSTRSICSGVQNGKANG